MNVVITGATKGLGRAIAEKFAADGHTIVATSRSEVDLYHLMNDLLTRFPQCGVKVMAADLANTQQVKSFAEWILQSQLSPGILINNAGQFIPGSIGNEPEGALENLMQVNLYSAYHLTRALLPAMIAARSGHIFNMCSIASFAAYANGGAYSISKFALAGFSKNLREELKPHQIKVTAVYPGAAMTPSWEGSGVSPHRIMTAGDIADMIVAATKLSPQAVVEDIILRPQLGDV